jgi:hypothetical protein
MDLIDAKINLLKREIDMMQRNGLVNEKTRLKIRTMVKKEYAKVLQQSIDVIIENQ